MIHVKQLIILATAAVIAAACSYDDSEWNTRQEKRNAVRFALSVPGAATPTAATRSLTDLQEKAVTAVDVLVFYTQGTHAGTLYSREQATWVAGNTYEIELAEGTYNLVVLGNATSIVNGTSGLVPQNITHTAAVASLMHTNTGEWTTPTIPMWGYVDNVTVDANTSLTGANAIDMHRMVSKVEVQLSTLAAGAGNSNFELTSVRFYNYNTKGRVAPDMSNWNPTGGVVNAGKGIATAPTIPTNPGAVTGVNNPLLFNATHGLTANNLLNTIYTFEATNGTAQTLTTNPCLVIGGRYQGGVETFYRVDFIKKVNDADTYLHLLRNHRYLFMVNSVTGDGHITPEEAFDAISFNIEVDVMQWEEGEITGFKFDGQNYLGVSQDVFELTSEARFSTSTDNKLKIRTDVPTGWTATVWADLAGTIPVPNDGATGNPWMRISINAGMGAGPADEMSINMDENQSGSERTAYIHLKAGRLTYVVEVIQRYHTLRVTDAVTGKEIVTLSFSNKRSTVDIAPAPRQIRVEWSPASETVTIEKIAGLPNLTWSADHTTPLTGGSALLTIDPPAITQQELDAIPYISKWTQLNFKLGTHAMSTLRVDHSHYELTAENFTALITDEFPNGSGTVKSNSPWKAICLNDLFVGGISQPNHSVYGGINTTGVPFDYSFVHANGTVTFVFCPTDMKKEFDPVYCTVNVDQLPLPPSDVYGIGELIHVGRTYVGAFWRSAQKGERLIRIPVTDEHKGRWAAQVLDYGDFNPGDIQFSTSTSPDHQVTYNTSNEIHTDPDLGGWYVNDKTFATGNAVIAGDYIYFRLGLKQTINPGTHRYARIVISYANFKKYQVIFLRQGEEPDYLMHPDDMLNGTQIAAVRKFSPYNLTAPDMTDAYYTDVAVRGGAFVDYPSKSGGLFAFSGPSGQERRAHNPAIYTIGAISQNVSVNWNASIHETCPPSYRRIRIPDVSNASTSEGTMSLLADKTQAIAPEYNTSNSAWGYYADGYFDRLATAQSVTGTIHSVVNQNSYNIGCAGTVVFNNKPDSPKKNASIFFPGSGHRGYTGSIGEQGNATAYWTSNNASGGAAVGLRLFSTGINVSGTSQRYHLYAMRCVLEE